MSELFLLVDRKSPESPLQFLGCVSRDGAHRLGYRHTSVLLIPTTWDDKSNAPIIFVHKRSPYKLICPNTYDFCGGHITFEHWYCHYLENSFDSLPLLERAADETAIREANEELKCEPQIHFQHQHIFRFQSFGYFECDTISERGRNAEFSTAYFVAIPKSRQVTIWDTDIHGERELAVKKFGLANLLNQFQEKEEIFADGAGRILKKLIADPSLQKEFEQLLREVNQCGMV
jgi:8-oxo-dGTP pyrophosphatase MutT (NUDIX family)